MTVRGRAVRMKDRVLDSVGGARRRVAERIESVAERIPTPSDLRDRADRTSDARDRGRADGERADDDQAQRDRRDGERADEDHAHHDPHDDLVERAERARRRAERLTDEHSAEAESARAEADDLARTAHDAAARAAEDARSRANEAIGRARRLADRALQRSRRLDRARRLGDGRDPTARRGSERPEPAGRTGEESQVEPGDASDRAADDVASTGGSPPDRSSRRELEEHTKDELYRMAQDREVDGRSSMTKGELIDALVADEAGCRSGGGDEPAEPQTG